MPKKKKSKKQIDIMFFYEALFITFILLLTAIMLLFININVSAKEESHDINIKTLEIAFWQDVIKNNPTYLEGYLKLYELTKNDSFLNEAKKINPVYFLLQ